MKRFLLVVLFCLLAVLAPCQEKSGAVADGLFATLGMRYNVPIFPLDGVGTPHSLPGFVLGAGFAMPFGGGALELGGEIGSIPMTAAYYMVYLNSIQFRAGYVHPLGDRLAFSAALMLGMLFPWAQADGVLVGNPLFPNPENRFAIEPPYIGARVGLEIPVNTRSSQKTIGRAAVYANAGADISLEWEGLVATPAIEVGLKFSPRFR